MTHLGDEPNSGYTITERDTKLTRFEYDHRGRLMSETTTLNDGDPALVSYGYDELGKLASKTYGEGANAITETYDYNIQGWLTEKSSDIFEMRLRYFDPQKPTTTPSFTGNITEWEWEHKEPGTTGIKNTYAFTYDKLSRLVDTDHYTGTSTTPVNSFVERGLEYDKNGNMLAMKRYQSSSSTPDEDMTFPVYSGNQLTTMVNNGTSYGYEYDSNGNMTTDSYNALKLNYNFLNLTSTARDMSGNVQATYSWLANGAKTGVRNAAGTSGYEYLGSLVYKRVNGDLQLESAGFGGGRIEVSNGSSGAVYTPNYYFTDHLGSTRAIYNGSPDIARSDFLPFGTRWTNAQAPTSRYQFTGYEDQDLLDKKYMDAGFRFQNRRTFNTIDPRAEKYYSISPYVYCKNNPLKYIDPRGDTTRVYIETTSNHGAGHAWISTGEGENMIVYTYGRYDGTNKSMLPNGLRNGPGVLVKLEGQDALDFNNAEIENNVQVFAIADADEGEINDFFDTKLNASDVKPSEGSKYGDHSGAKVVDEYKLTSNNCTTMVSDALNISGSQALRGGGIYLQTSNFGTSTFISTPSKLNRFVLPANLRRHLNNNE